MVDEHRDATAMVAVALALLVITLTGLLRGSRSLVTLALLGVAAWAAWAPRPGDSSRPCADPRPTHREEPSG